MSNVQGGTGPDTGKIFDLQERLVDYAVRIIRVVDALGGSRAAAHIGGQVLRSGTSPAANYAEAQSAESRADFIHKIKVVLKELRETRVWLTVIARAGLVKPATRLEYLLHESEELIAIFVRSEQTARRNSKRSPAT
jgi:four helix bundle protein